MSKAIVSLIVALVSAAAGLAAVAYGQYAARKLERQQWEQAQKDALHALMADLGKELTSRINVLRGSRGTSRTSANYWRRPIF